MLMSLHQNYRSAVAQLLKITDIKQDQQTGRQTDRRTERPTDRWTDKQTDGWTDRPKDRRVFGSKGQEGVSSGQAEQARCLLLDQRLYLHCLVPWGKQCSYPILALRPHQSPMISVSSTWPDTEPMPGCLTMECMTMGSRFRKPPRRYYRLAPNPAN